MGWHFRRKSFILELMERVRKAKELARIAHWEQKYGDQPYSVHLEAVANVLVRFGYGDREDLLVSAYLHDSLEDTELPESAVLEFGENVLKLVKAVTNEAGADRKERLAKTYPKIRANPEAMLLKLADRIANVEASASNPKKLAKYKAEFVGFKEALYDENNLPMWEHLGNLLK